jgi:mannose-6-phosphate isomerase-like protein (cupin superfamily)
MSQQPRVVIRPDQALDGGPMQQADGGVRDLRLIHPDTGCDAMTLSLGLVEIEPGHHTPLHRHRCEEVYYVVQGSGEVETEDVRRPIAAGCAVFHRANTIHCVYNTGDETLRLVAVAGVMLMPPRAQWPTPSPYEVFEGSTAGEHPAKTGRPAWADWR